MAPGSDAAPRLNPPPCPQTPSQEANVAPIPISIEIDLRHGLIATSYVFTGLATLHRLGKIRLRVRAPAVTDIPRHAGEVCARFQVGTPSGRPVPVLYDLRDRSDQFFMDDLEETRLYFKRTFVQSDVDALPGNLRPRVHPGGVTFACMAAGVRMAPFAQALRLMVNPGLREGRRRMARRLVDYARIPALEGFIAPPSAGKRGVVLFQTRVWEDSEVPEPDSAEEVNGQRVALVRTLRAAFGDRFVGGLLPTPMALERWPELVTRRGADQPSYLRLIREAAVAVYSRGLHHSTAYKLGEYMAASCAVVSDPIRSILPAPLNPGVHFAPYSTTDECAAQCDRLLTWPEARMELRVASHDYFSREIRPDSRMSRVITMALAEGEDPPD
jgi:hypothetical protein